MYSNVQGGNAFVVLNNYDGTNTRFDNYYITSLSGNSYNNIVSIEIYAFTPMTNGLTWYATLNRELEPYGLEGYLPNNSSADPLTASQIDYLIYPASDLVITELYIELWD